MVRQSRVRVADQGRDQGDDSRPARRGIQIGGAADDVPQMRERVDRRGGMGQSVLTTGFSRVDGVMLCEDVPIERIAREIGTPVYVYSTATIRDRYERVER